MSWSPPEKVETIFLKCLGENQENSLAKKDSAHNLSPTLQAQRCKIGKNEGCWKKMRISSQAFTK